VSVRIPPDQWTDEEWLRLLRELPPATSAEEAERVVARWRAEERKP